MAHETPTLTAQPRPRTGSRYAQRLRSSGRLPGIIYGHKTDPVPVSVDQDELVRLIEHGAHVINLQVEGSAKETCLVKDLQFGYLGDNVIHVDFARVNLDERVKVNVHLHFVGAPEDAKRHGAIVSHPLTELEIECKVSDIPDEIKVDLSPFVSTVTVGDVVLPPGMTTSLDPTTPVVTVGFIHREEVAVGEAVEVEGEEEPEVITEAKKEEEEAGAGG